MPFVFVLVLSILRDAYEDLSKHRNDLKLNASKCLKYVRGKWEEVDWKDIYVGDVVRCHQGDMFPADLLAIQSSNANGDIY